jgi:mono/diheme cytochrome c family protein
MKRESGPIGAVLLALALPACSDGGGDPLDPAVRGERVYQNVCIACHSADPTRDSALGPAIAGASRELLEARVLRGEYPPGYTPKRSTGVMPPFPNLEEQIPALVAYLARAAAP